MLPKWPNDGSSHNIGRPLHKAAARFGSRAIASGCPKENGGKKEVIGYLGKNPEHKSVKESGRKYAVFAGDSAILEGCRRRMAFPDEVASRRSDVESEATSNRCVIWRLQSNASELRPGHLPRRREPQ
jgi:hypothetical protein